MGLPACLEVLPEIDRDVAAGFFDVIHDICLVHHVPLPEGHKLLEVVSEKLSANIQPVLRELSSKCQVNKGRLITSSQHAKLRFRAEEAPREYS